MTLNPYDIILNPYVTEKTMNRLDAENKIELIVRREATKPMIRWAVKDLFDVEVESVHTRISTRGEKLATVKFAPSVNAEDIAMRIGIF